VQIEENIPLAPFTTLRIGGPARYFARVTSEDELLETVRFARATADYSYVEVSGGMEWDAFVRLMCEKGISGVECLAGIPGLVGGAPIQNIGAYGQEVSQTIASVRALDRETGFFTELSAEACRFAYRSSLFNSTEAGRYIVTRVDFNFDLAAAPNLTYADLKKHFAGNPNPTPLEVYEAVRQIRRAKGMLILPDDTEADFRSAGSFFKNPVVPAVTLAGIAEALSIDPEKVPHWPAGAGEIKVPAAWLIEQAGFPKGYVQGEAGISSRHTLALVNQSGHASYADLAALRDTIILRVQSLFGISLHQEPVSLG
jgi:UDP-N-acetylmuramate dehydrogenase